MNDNSIWKKCKVHALPTMDKSNIIDVFGTLKYFNPPDATYESKNKHLYITSNEEIQELP